MNRVEKDKMFFTEAKRQIDELKEQNKKMYEALNYAYEILASVETKYPTRDSAIGQFKMAGIRSLLMEMQS